MIYGIGTDICDVRRILASLQRHGDRLAETVLAEGEHPTWRGPGAGGGELTAGGGSPVAPAVGRATRGPRPEARGWKAVGGRR